MVECLKGLEPRRVLELFSDISDIPRGSGNEKAVSDYVRAFCENIGIEVEQDEAFNIIARKPATPGYENAPICVLQAHLDMVCEKNADVHHDFLKDPIRILLDGDRIHADGTTLGADDGTGVAFAMAVLESKDLPHPAIEVVLTANEEAGMTGIRALDFSKLRGRVIINLDCSDVGIVVGCAGTAAVQLTQPMDLASLADEAVLCLSIRGLLGGHSGLDIAKERANANVLVQRVLSAMQEVAPVRLVSLTGGLQGNAITREADALFAVPTDRMEAVKLVFQQMEKKLKNEYRVTDKGLSMTLGEAHADAAFTAESTDRLLALMTLLPSGVMCMNIEVPGLPELSGNLGIVTTDREGVHITALYRSCYDSRKRQAIDKCRRAAGLTGARMHIASDSPEWEYKADSRLSALIQRVHLAEYGEPIVIEVSHGGNECGTFFREFPDADIVCTGTRIIAPHTPDESVMVSIIQKEWNMLCKTLEGMLTY